MSKTLLESEFLSNMSHDLRVPLSSIIGISESLIEGVYGILNDKQYEALQNIEESGRHLLAMINDIIDVSKIEVGKIELELNSVSIQKVCQSSLRFIRSEAQKKNIKVTPKFNIIPEVLYADERRLKQILAILLNNAVKSTPKGGDIGFDVSCKPGEHIIQFTVWDTGIGASQEKMKALLKSSDHSDKKLTQNHDEIWLGLELMQRLVEMHKGNIVVENEVDESNRFIVSLPWQKNLNTVNPEQELKQYDSELLQNGNSKRLDGTLILIAEDNELFIKTIVTYLTINGAKIITAQNGYEAISMAIENNPDIILMDIQMPGMDGYDAIQFMRDEPNLSNIPIIVLTGLDMPDDRERCLKAGANEYISKTDSLGQLVGVINKLLEGELPPHECGGFLLQRRATQRH
jgi:CheY-like chemotaxis protein